MKDIQLIQYYPGKSGKIKFKFFELHIYKLLKDHGFRYTKFNKKGFYLKKDKGVYKVCNFQELIDFFVKYIEENFERLKFPKEIDKELFINEIYAKRPIKNGDFARCFLGKDFELTKQNLDIILEELNIQIK
jgi:hypothetical protein